MRLLSLLAAASLLQHVCGTSHHRNPLDQLAVVEDPVIHTPSHRVHAHQNSFDISFFFRDHKKQRIKLTLEPNTDILAPDARVRFLDPYGNTERAEPIRRTDHRVFKGWSWEETEDGWNRVGWARISVKRDGAEPLFEGAFTVMHDQHHVLLKSNFMRTRHPDDPMLDDAGDDYMVLYRDSDVGLRQLKRSVHFTPTCTADTLGFNADLKLRSYSPAVSSTPSIFRIGRRQDIANGNVASGNVRNSIGSSTGCFTTRKIALVGIAADCEFAGSFSSKKDVQDNIVDTVNGASELYEKTFNISLTIGDINILSENCPSSASSSAPFNLACTSKASDGSNLGLTQRLSLFSAWRAKKDDDYAFWTLMTKCRTGSEVGLAWLRQVCVKKSSDARSSDGDNATVSGANVVSKIDTNWQVYAHEAGHLFGAVHDCETMACRDPKNARNSLCCPLDKDNCDAGGKYIMNPTAGNGITKFSPCSVGQICSNIGQGLVDTSCLSHNRGVKNAEGQKCGNGIVESGEDCDCGGDQECAGNKCCNPKTCKFVNDAVCDDANEECCSGCKFASSGTVCRKSTGKCDPEEKCSGKSGECPKDEHASDGTDCSSGMKCASGQCTSRNQQCLVIMGDDVAGNDTVSCDSNSCLMSCRDSHSSSRVCLENMQNFLDGTPCGGSGKCNKGQCEGDSFTKSAKAWIDSHKSLVIGLASGLGGFIFLLIAFCLFQRCRRPRPKNRKMAPISMASITPQSAFDEHGRPLSSLPGTLPAHPPRSHGRSRGSRSAHSGQGQQQWGDGQENGFTDHRGSALYPPQSAGSRSMRNSTPTRYA